MKVSIAFVTFAISTKIKCPIIPLYFRKFYLAVIQYGGAFTDEVDHHQTIFTICQVSIKNYEVKENNPKEELALENSYSEPDVKSFLLSNVRDWKRVPITLRMKNWSWQRLVPLLS